VARIVTLKDDKGTPQEAAGTSFRMKRDNQGGYLSGRHMEHHGMW